MISVHHTRFDMNSYDEIRSMLEAELEVATTRYEGEAPPRHYTSAALAKSIDRYRRFAYHGMIPAEEDDLSD